MYELVCICCCVQNAMAPLAFAAMCGQVAIVKHFLKLNDIDISLPAVSVPATCIYMYIL